MAHQPLYWDATYEIVLTLMATHPDVDINQLGIGQLLNYILALPNFSDDPILANDKLLYDILREWYEESNS